MRRQRLLLRLYPWELDSMPEYSTSIPTGTTIGKFWKKNQNVFTNEEPKWVVCMYGPHEDPKYVTIVYFDVELKAGPPTGTYQPPDWSNFQQWKRERYAKELLTARTA